MDMRVNSNTTAATPAPARKEYAVKRETEHIADRYDMSRSFGNYISGAVTGAVTETAATVLQAPRLAWEIAENLWQAETIGPNLKTLGTLAAIPAAVATIPFAPFYGAFHGISMVRDARREERETPLTPDTSAGVARQMTAPKPDGEARTMTGKLVKGLEELGAEKLEPGEKPKDVPILSPVFAFVGGTASAVIGGCVGLAAGLVAGAITGAKDVRDAFTQEGLSVGGRVGKAVLSPLNLMAGPVLGWKSLKEGLFRGTVDGWNHGLVKPLVDTARISASLGAGVIKEAWEK